ncbi:MAG: Gfo/Idh/MocA family oxidoreductase, partial [Acidimicrobiales bacterium]
LGVMGRSHARVLGGLDGVELVGIADPALPAGSAVDDTKVVHDLDDLLACGVEACVVAVPTAEHLPVGLALAAAGVHALIEKPLALDCVQGRQLVEAFTAAGLVGCVGHVERFNAALRALHTRLEQGELGEIYQVATSRQGPFPARIRDVGVVKDLATHDLDLTAWITGSSYVEVSAQVSRRAGRPHEDLVAAVGRLADGTVANHLVNWLSPFKQRQIVVTGEAGSFTADTLTADLTFHANGLVQLGWDALSQFRGVSEGDVIRFAIPKPEPLAVELSAFRDAVTGGPLAGEAVTLAEGLGAVAAAEAVLEAAATRRTVTLGAPPA